MKFSKKTMPEELNTDAIKRIYELILNPLTLSFEPLKKHPQVVFQCDTKEKAKKLKHNMKIKYPELYRPVRPKIREKLVVQHEEDVEFLLGNDEEEKKETKMGIELVQLDEPEKPEIYAARIITTLNKKRKTEQE